MDPQRFDTWVRSQLAVWTRRSLAGTALAALVSRVTLQEVAAASCTQGGQRCTENGECCTDLCRTGKNKCTSCTKESVCNVQSLCGPAGSSCECFFTAEKKKRCVNFLDDCGAFPTCKKTANCAEGSVCTKSCCGKRCVPLCGNTVTSSAGARSAGTGSGSLKD